MSRVLTILLVFSLVTTTVQRSFASGQAGEQADSLVQDDDKQDGANPSEAEDQSQTGQDSNGDDEGVHNALRDLREGMLNAIEAKNVDILISMMTEDVVLTTQDGSKLKTIRKQVGVRSYIERLLTGPDAGVKRMKINLDMDEKTILYGDETGIAFGKSKDQYTLKDGTQFELETCWSATVVKQSDDKWKIANLQLSTNLFDNPVLNSTKRWLVWIGGVGLLFGMILGALLMRLLKRK